MEYIYILFMEDFWAHSVGEADRSSRGKLVLSSFHHLFQERSKQTNLVAHVVSTKNFKSDFRSDLRGWMSQRPENLTFESFNQKSSNNVKKYVGFYLRRSRQV